MNINNLNYRPPTSCSELNKQERTTGMPMEDWLRGCVYHDGRFGKVLEIANYIQATRTGIDGDGMVYFPSNEESRTMTREKAIELLSNDAFKLCMVQLRDPLFEECYEALNMAIEALEQVPKRGKWIDDDNYLSYANCSECGYQMDMHEERGYHNFCPNCGARMEVEK